MKLLLIIGLMMLFSFTQAQQIDSIITKESLEQTVKYLSSDTLYGRLTGSKGITYAANYIKQYFIANKIYPINIFPNYYDSFVVFINNKGVFAANIIGIIPSICKNDSIIIISAHYDHIGEGKDLLFNNKYSEHDLIYNGANDNASGVAAILEIAKYYSAKKNNKYNIMVIAFSAEELGEIGSQQFANLVDVSLVKAVINLDMVGRPRIENENSCMVITDKPKLVQILNGYLLQDTSYKQKHFFIKDSYPDQDLFFRSDHYSFYKKVPITFSFITTSPLDKYYHSVKDEYNTINFDFLLSTTKKIAIACKFFIE